MVPRRFPPREGRGIVGRTTLRSERDAAEALAVLFEEVRVDGVVDGGLRVGHREIEGVGEAFRDFERGGASSSRRSKSRPHVSASTSGVIGRPLFAAGTRRLFVRRRCRVYRPSWA
ncbi:hypothetical protein ACFQJD_00310 [Haloplanus sp. GCM10025708]|uniref:hypothetical protein n=1 Tax=Haloplanus sp. GCM10025708 TaxID=3252679 RepID=UPI00361440BA